MRSFWKSVPTYSTLPYYVKPVRDGCKDVLPRFINNSKPSFKIYREKWEIRVLIESVRKNVGNLGCSRIIKAH